MFVFSLASFVMHLNSQNIFLKYIHISCYFASRIFNSNYIYIYYIYSFIYILYIFIHMFVFCLASILMFLKKQDTFLKNTFLLHGWLSHVFSLKHIY